MSDNKALLMDDGENFNLHSKVPALTQILEKAYKNIGKR